MRLRRLHFTSGRSVASVPVRLLLGGCAVAQTVQPRNRNGEACRRAINLVSEQ